YLFALSVRADRAIILMASLVGSLVLFKTRVTPRLSAGLLTGACGAHSLLPPRYGLVRRGHSGIGCAAEFPRWRVIPDHFQKFTLANHGPAADLCAPQPALCEPCVDGPLTDPAQG